MDLSTLTASLADLPDLNPDDDSVVRAGFTRFRRRALRFPFRFFAFSQSRLSGCQCIRRIATTCFRRINRRGQFFPLCRNIIRCQLGFTQFLFRTRFAFSQFAAASFSGL